MPPSKEAAKMHIARCGLFLPALALVGAFCFGAAPVRADEVAPATPHDYRDANFDYFVAGDPRTPRAAHTTSGLALMGGGGSVDSAFEFIARNAGGGHIVILRATADPAFDASDGDYGQSFVGKWGPVASAETIVFRNREAASDARVLAVLHGADGIYLAGGDQSNYIRYWKGTPVQDALNAHVRQHRPLGGSSAGLAILGRYSYTAFDGGSMESKLALADPFNSGVTLESDFLHCPGLDQVITDSHFSARSRLGRLITFVARLNADAHATRVSGIGIDEKTALLIDDKGSGHLAEGSAGSAWLVRQSQPAKTLSKGQPLIVENVQVTRIDGRSTIDLKTNQVTRPGASGAIAIHAGQASPPPLLQKILLRDVVPPDEP